MKLPLKWDDLGPCDGIQITDAANDCIVSDAGDLSEDEAKVIVRAVNCHDDLVDTLDKLKDYFDEHIETCDSPGTLQTLDIMRSMIVDSLGKARKA